MCGLEVVHGAGVFIMTRLDLVVFAGGKSLQIQQERYMSHERSSVYGQVRGVRRESEGAWLRWVWRMLWRIGK